MSAAVMRRRAAGAASRGCTGASSASCRMLASPSWYGGFGVRVEVLQPALLAAVAGGVPAGRAARRARSAHLDHRRARVGCRSAKRALDASVGARGLPKLGSGERRRDVADPLALQRVAVERGLASRRAAWRRRRRGCVARSSGSVPVVTLSMRARSLVVRGDRAREVLQPRQRHDARAGGDAVRAAQRDQRRAGRRRVERVAGLRAHAERRRSEVADGGRRAAGGAERRLRRLERVPHHAVPDSLSRCRRWRTRDRLPLPMITAPASRSLATWNASRFGRQPSNARLPSVVGMSLVS